MSADGSSYRQTLRSWSIMGGAASLNYLIGLVRIKIVAILLGPSGVGLIGLYASAIGLVGTISRLGIGGSAAREIALAANAEDPYAVARTSRIVQRACWATGIFGWLLAILVSRPLSNWLFDSTEHMIVISVLGVTLLFNALEAARQALLLGLRRIEDVARANVLGALLSTVAAAGLYAWLGKDGILPVMVVTAFISLALAHWFSSRVAVISTEVSWADTFKGTKRLLGTGTAFMLNNVNVAALDTLTRSIVASGFGIHAAGIYQSAWGLSSTFGGVILASMGTDFYPRLTGVIHDKTLAKRLVNEQIEVLILMGLPALLSALTFAPMIMTVVYSREFLEGVEVLRWLMLGVFFQSLSWPMSIIPLAKGAGRWAMGVSMFFTLTQAVMIFLMARVNGLVGVAQAIVAVLALQVLAMLWVGHRLIDFEWSLAVKRLVIISGGFIFACFTIPLLLQDDAAVFSGGVVTTAGCVVCLRGLTKRTGLRNQLARRVNFLSFGWIKRGKG